MTDKLIKKPWVYEPDILVEQLEERIVLDATVDSAPENQQQDASQETQSNPEQTSETTAQGQIETAVNPAAQNPDNTSDSLDNVFGQDLNVVLISNAVDHIEAFSDAVADDAQVIVYDASSDTLETVVSELEALTESTGQQIGHLAIISHGESGELVLDPADDIYSLDNLSEYSAVWMRLGGTLSEDARIDFYGCDIGQGEEGQEFVSQVSQLTGAIVWASDDDTGNVEGADWTLEVQTAPSDEGYLVETSSLDGYSILLPKPGDDDDDVDVIFEDGIPDIIRFEDSADTVLSLDDYLDPDGNGYTYEVSLITDRDLLNDPEFSHYLSENPLNANDPLYPDTNPYQWFNETLLVNLSTNTDNELTLDYNADEFGVNLLLVKVYDGHEQIGYTVFSVAVIPTEEGGGDEGPDPTQIGVDADDNIYDPITLPDNGPEVTVTTNATLNGYVIVGDTEDPTVLDAMFVIQGDPDDSPELTANLQLWIGDEDGDGQFEFIQLATNDLNQDLIDLDNLDGLADNDEFYLLTVGPNGLEVDPQDPLHYEMDVSLTAFTGYSAVHDDVNNLPYFDYTFSYNFETFDEAPFLGFGDSNQTVTFLGSDITDVNQQPHDEFGDPPLVQGDPTTSVFVGDIDNDGDLDLVIGVNEEAANESSTGSWGQYSLVYRNDGNRIFTLVEIPLVEEEKDRTTDVVLGDLNNDGLLDLVGVTEEGPDFYYLNLGDVTFEDGVATSSIDVRLEGYYVIESEGIIDAGGDNPIADEAGSVDSIWFEIEGNAYEFHDVGDSVHIDGFGTFTATSDVMWQQFGDTTKYYIELSFTADDDFDSSAGIDYDMVVASDLYGTFYDEHGNVIGTNTNASGDESADYDTFPSLWAGFSDPMALPGTDGNQSPETLAVAVGDFNNDGWLDVITGENTRSVIYWNLGEDGGGNWLGFADGEQVGPANAGNSQSAAIEVGDVNADGFLDFYLGKQSGGGGTDDLLFVNNGDGTFTVFDVEREGQTLAVNMTDLDATLGRLDFDPSLVNWNDIDWDAVLGNQTNTNVGGENQYIVNFTGDPVDHIEVVSTEDNRTWDVFIWDVDGDGIFDLVVGNSQHGTSNFDGENPGQGDPIEQAKWYKGIIVPDGNGGYNVAFENEGQLLGPSLQYFAWKGTPNTDPEQVYSSNFQTHAVWSADFDGDGNPDVFLGNIRGFDLILWSEGHGDPDVVDHPRSADALVEFQIDPAQGDDDDDDDDDDVPPGDDDDDDDDDVPPGDDDDDDDDVPIGDDDDDDDDVPIGDDDDDDEDVTGIKLENPFPEVLRFEEPLNTYEGFELEPLTGGIQSRFDATFTPRPIPPVPGFIFPYLPTEIELIESEFGELRRGPEPLWNANMWEVPEFTDAGAELRPAKFEGVVMAALTNPIPYAGGEEGSAPVLAFVTGGELAEDVAQTPMLVCYAGGECVATIGPEEAKQIYLESLKKMKGPQPLPTSAQESDMIDGTDMAFIDVMESEEVQAHATETATDQEQGEAAAQVIDPSDTSFTDLT